MNNKLEFKQALIVVVLTAAAVIIAIATAVAL